MTGAAPPGDEEADQVGQNIAAVHEFYLREEQKISASQRAMERLTHFIGRPLFSGALLAAAVLWMGANLTVQTFGMLPVDPVPFPLLQGVVGVGALLTSLVVLSRQNRLARLAEQREHLDLKVTLLTEQKAAKMIHLLEELRRDLPNVRDRHDSDAKALQQAMNPQLVLAALDESQPPTDRARLAVTGAAAEAPRPGG